ncbi:hypothetical protein STEG23_006064 [Scotinomys teguina]
MQPVCSKHWQRDHGVVDAAPRCQLLLIVLMAVMLLLGMKGSALLVQRKIARTIKLQGSIGKDFQSCKQVKSFGNSASDIDFHGNFWEVFFILDKPHGNAIELEDVKLDY